MGRASQDAKLFNVDFNTKRALNRDLFHKVGKNTSMNERIPLKNFNSRSFLHCTYSTHTHQGYNFYNYINQVSNMISYHDKDHRPHMLRKREEKQLNLLRQRKLLTETQQTILAHHTPTLTNNRMENYEKVLDKVKHHKELMREQLKEIDMHKA